MTSATPRHWKQDPLHSEWQLDFALLRLRIGAMLGELGRPSDAEAEFRLGRDVAERLVRHDPQRADAQRELSVACEQLGSILVDQGKLDAAMAEYHACRLIREQLLRSNPSSASWRRDLANCHRNLANVLMKQGRRGPAVAELRTAMALVNGIARDPSTQELLGTELMAIENEIAIVTAASGHVARENG